MGAKKLNSLIAQVENFQSNINKEIDKTVAENNVLVVRENVINDLYNRIIEKLKELQSLACKRLQEKRIQNDQAIGKARRLEQKINKLWE